jgi:HrpA-like RNA helicase
VSKQTTQNSQTRAPPKPNVLVFLSSIPEIKRVLDKASQDKQLTNPSSELQWPLFKFEELHGALTPEEKMRVLDPIDDLSAYVRIILSTSIAETAVTIHNVKYVLDSGREREYFLDELTTLSYMKEENISKSSAIQRQGRAGRVCNGYCYRMYTKEDYEKFEERKKPEIVRMDISDLILFSVELNDYFKMSDLLFYDKYPHIEHKITNVARMLEGKGCFKIENHTNVLTPKGKFIVESSLETYSAAFLYESLIMNNDNYGLITTIILEKPTGYFRNNDALKRLGDREIGLDNPILNRLGDIAPILFLMDRYEDLPFEKKRMYEKEYGITSLDMKRIRSDISKLQ